MNVDSEESKVRRGSHRTNSPQLLRDAGIAFEGFNAHADGTHAHLVVTHSGTVVDFWPGTGLWIVRDQARRGRGVFNLIRELSA